MARRTPGEGSCLGWEGNTEIEVPASSQEALSLSLEVGGHER